MIVDVVVHEGGGVNDLYGSGQRDRLVYVAAARGSVGQQDQTRTKALAARRQNVRGRLAEQGHSATCHGEQKLFNCLEGYLAGHAASR